MIDINELDQIGLWEIKPDGISGKPTNFPTYFIPNDMIFATREMKNHLVWEWPIFIASMNWSTEKDVVDLHKVLLVKMSVLETPAHLEELKYEIHWKTVCIMLDIVQSKHGNAA